MMGALPQTATFALPLPLAAAGAALPQGGGEAGGFEQIVALQANAAAPVTAPDAAADAPVFSLAAPEAGVPEGSKQVAAKPIAASPDATEPQVETGDGKTAAPTPPKAEPEASGEEAVAVASRLAGTLGRFVTAQPARTPAAVKPGEAQEEGEAGASETDDDAPVLAWAPAPPAAAAPAADKPARDAARQPAAHRDDAPAMPMAAPKPREAAQPLPAMAFAVAEPQAAKPAAEPSMTVIFTQPAAQTAGIAEAARPAVVAERVLDLTSDDGWIDRLASDIAATKSASGELSFRLMPRHLGRLDVAITAGDDGVSLTMDTQHEKTATIVAAAQPRLVEDLRQQGVRVADAQVTHTPGEAGRQSQQGQGRMPGEDATHLIETDRAETRSETRDEERAAHRRGRFA